jgi:predicted ATP-grasp superfamily ATP-dependent carboligase
MSQLTELEPLEEDEIASRQTTTIVKKRQPRRPNRIFEVDQTYETLAAAQEVLIQEKNWSEISGYTKKTEQAHWHPV